MMIIMINVKHVFKRKITKKPFSTAERNTNLLDLIHSDICEFNGVLTRGGKRYFITFIDDCSKFTYVYLLSNKDEAFECFKRYKAEVENQKGRKLNAFVVIEVVNIFHMNLISL